MRSNQRDKKQGFTLLETLIAFAIGSLVIVAGFGVVAQASNRQAQVKNRFELTRFARATLTEYAVTYPMVAVSGVYADKWQWKISEKVQPQPDLKSIGMFVDYVQIFITVSNIHQPLTDPVSMTTAVVRRAEIQ